MSGSLQSAAPRATLRRGTITVVGTVAVLIASACATTPKAYIDMADESPDCERFAWLEVAERPATLDEQRLRAEVMGVLQAKGYAVEATDPDCRVSGVIFSGDRPGSPVSVGLGAGRWGGSFGGSVGISLPLGGKKVVGNLAIDVIDVERNAQVWRGTLEDAFRDPDPEAGVLRAAVEQLMEDFPRRGGG